ncbi:hypothetical protein [Candidatus Viridilinea mediisalina]|uniref:Uncharacterized protein n=1 Tax=Candidatus Viridilinea mediisalina TaxID=2024553 RepID=A0A2A6RM83_9CHLR|nr:hypothetical protein [Candidatus Viridilinea mediisalina]PDW04035.1 hypothetical protein CJ255_05540 [Candidatus Viridilinea mediisalina]
MISQDPEDDARVLVVVVTRPRDLALAREAGWYRVPLARVPSRLAADYLAFYQTAAFGPERWAVRYYAPVLRYRIATRLELLPDEPEHPRAAERYYRIELGPLAELPLPVPAARLRRVAFIATTFGQLRRASDVRQLFHPAEDARLDPDLWGAGLAGRRLR